MSESRWGSDDSEPIALVTVGWFWNPMNAWIVRNRLADEGIDAFLADEHVASTYWLYANAIMSLTGHSWFEFAATPSEGPSW